MSPPAAPTRSEPTPARSGQPFWFRERSNILHRICTSIERRRERGQAVRKAARYFARRWSGRSYRAAPHIKVRFSRATITKLYYLWRRSGRGAESLALGYRTRPVTVSRTLTGRLLAACSGPDILSMSAAVRQVQPAGFSPRALIDSLPPETRLAIRAAHRARFDLKAQDRAIARRILALSTATP